MLRMFMSRGTLLMLQRRQCELTIGGCLLLLLLLLYCALYTPVHQTKIDPEQTQMGQIDAEPDGPRTDGPRKVVLVTYTRGGSSLLGEAFNQYNASMYWFEPLYGLYVDLYGAHVTSHGIQGDRELPIYEEEAVIETILDMFNCNLQKLSPGVLFNQLQPMLHNLMPKSSQRFIGCLWAKSGNATRSIDPTTCASLHLASLCTRSFTNNKCYGRLHETPGFWTGDTTARLTDSERSYVRCVLRARRRIAQCLPALEDQCTRAELHSAKLVRLRMPSAIRLLQRDPGIQIIHLLRDPRGILNSRHRDAADRQAAMVHDAKVLCSTIVRDIEASEYLQKRSQNAVLTVKYEDVATEPLKNLDRMYKYLRLETPEAVRSWFNSTMHRGESKSGGSSTRKKDPKGIAVRWQNTLDNKTMGEINSICQLAIQKSRYTL